jgi:hypothetical protein
VESAEEKWIAQQYDNLFSRVADRLRIVVDDRALVPGNAKISTGIVPSVFRDPKEVAESIVDLPAEAVAWVDRDRKRLDAAKALDDLINTFLLLLALGAFGSLIFLTRDYIEKTPETKTSAYVFRPLLGMFLAMGIFIVDVFAHTLISGSKTTDIRPEPLYILSLAAGLLSERAYQYVSNFAQDALDRREREEVGRDEHLQNHQAGGQQIAPPATTGNRGGNPLEEPAKVAVQADGATVQDPAVVRTVPAQRA